MLLGEDNDLVKRVSGLIEPFKRVLHRERAYERITPYQKKLFSVAYLLGPFCCSTLLDLNLLNGDRNLVLLPFLDKALQFKAR